MNYKESIYYHSPILIQNLLLNFKSLELYHERYGRKFREKYVEFEKNQWLSKSDLENRQSKELVKLIRHAYETVPFYHARMKKIKLKPDDFKGLDDLYKLPILTKDDIKTNFDNLISTNIKKRVLRHGHTSGTTGSPLNVCYDIATCVVHHVVDWRQKSWAGLTYGEPFASLQGRIIVPLDQKKPPFWRKNYINNQLFLSSFHLAEENIASYFQKLSKDNIQFVEGYPSNLYILAIYLAKKGRVFPLKGVLTSSETLFRNQRELIEKVFCCKVFDFYGMAERTVFATECQKHSGHHLNMDYGITEFLDSNNEPVELGRLGGIVATSLHNYAMPFIRYRTNDSCSLKINSCSCGREFPLMEDVATKNESIVTLHDGRLISPSVLTHPFKPMKNIIESQIVQESLNLLRVKIVVNKLFSVKEEKQLVAAFTERLGREIKIEIEYVGSIPRTDSGKYKWVVSKIEPNFTNKV